MYLGLKGLDAAAAESFATEPDKWVTHLSRNGGTNRRFLIRNCYLNPSTFARYRPFWTRAGFRVVDCPSLTQQGKSSTDINLVLDAVDALSNVTRYDEFVIASADADFTSLIHRCRAADRFVMVITSGPVASAYRSVADVVLEVDALVKMAPALPQPHEPLAADSDRPNANPSRSEPVSPSAPQPPDPGPSAASAVSGLLRSANGPVAGAVVAHAAKNADPTLIATGWDGDGSFGAWITSKVSDAGYSSRPAPGFAWDRARFTETDLPWADNAALSALQRQVVRVTDIPSLTKEEYRLLLEVLAGDIAQRPFDRNETSKRVRDACQDRGTAIGRGPVLYVIQGLLYCGTDLKTAMTASELAEKWAANVFGLCRAARMEFNAQDLIELQDWVGGGLTARSAQVG